MPINGKKITFSVRLPHDLFWKFTDLANHLDKGKSEIAVPMIQKEVERLRKKYGLRPSQTLPGLTPN